MSVYVIQMNFGKDYFSKIGMSRNINKRISSIQTATPLSIDVGWKIEVLSECPVRYIKTETVLAERMDTNELIYAPKEKVRNGKVYGIDANLDGALEKELHHLYRKFGVGGEWFCLSAKTLMETFTKCGDRAYEVDLHTLKSMAKIGNIRAMSDIYQTLLFHKFSISAVEIKERESIFKNSTTSDQED